MSDGPWIKFYPSDWLTGTRGLTASEIGIYVTLIAMMYEKGRPLTNDGGMLARSCGVSRPQFDKAVEKLTGLKKLTLIDGALFHDRVEKELASRKKISDSAAKSASSRWEKEQVNQPSEDADALRNASIAGAGQISDIRSQKEDLLNIVDRTSPSAGSPSPKAKSNRGTRLSPDWKLPKALGDWAMSEFPLLTADDVRRLAEDFRDYWISIPGQRGCKLDWPATWRGSVRRFAPKIKGPSGLRGVSAMMEDFRKELENDELLRTQGDQGARAEIAGGLPLLIGHERRRD